MPARLISCSIWAALLLGCGPELPGGTQPREPDEEVVCGAPDLVDQVHPKRLAEDPTLGGLRGCTHHLGRIRVVWVADLSFLNTLREVDGRLTLDTPLEMTSLTGLERLSRAGELFIHNGRQIQGLRSLSSLRSVESLMLRHLPELDSLEGLEGLQAVDLLELINIDALRDLRGLEGLRELGSLDISHNESLETLSGLAALERVDRVEITSNPRLPRAEIEALLARIQVSGSTKVEDNGP